MANVTIREYADIAVTYGGKVPQAGAEPEIADQQVTTSAASAQSAVFNVNTRLVCISVPATAVACKFGTNPTALITTSMRLPANSITFFGIRAGDKVALIDVA
jgi:hypothetical protein